MFKLSSLKSTYLLSNPSIPKIGYLKSANQTKQHFTRHRIVEMGRVELPSKQISIKNQRIIIRKYS